MRLLESKPGSRCRLKSSLCGRLLIYSAWTHPTLTPQPPLLDQEQTVPFHFTPQNLVTLGSEAYHGLPVHDLYLQPTLSVTPPYCQSNCKTNCTFDLLLLVATEAGHQRIHLRNQTSQHRIFILNSRLSSCEILLSNLRTSHLQPQLLQIVDFSEHPRT